MNSTYRRLSVVDGEANQLFTWLKNKIKSEKSGAWLWKVNEMDNPGDSNAAIESSSSLNNTQPLIDDKSIDDFFKAGVT